MINIKVLSIRKLTRNLSVMLFVFLSIVLLIFILAFAAYFVEQDFKDSLFEKARYTAQEAFSDEVILASILENEIPVLALTSTQSVDDLTYSQVNNSKKIVDDSNTKNSNDMIDNTNSVTSNATNDISTEKTNTIHTEKNDISVQVKEKIKYDMPQKYNTEKYQNGNVKVGSVTILNYSKKDLNLSELAKPSKFNFSLDNDFLIFHTHATESYTVPDVSSVVNFRTTDKKYNMVSIGEALISALKNKGYFCFHDDALHDYPSYNGAYKSSLETVEACMKDKKYDFVIDVHRDALSSNLHFRPTTEINGERAAKLMFVIGTNACGLSHDEWMENLKLALLIQNRANEMYPGLFRDLTLSSSRYNQHVSNGAFIIEVGATGNSLEEARTSMKYLAEVIDSFHN